MREAVLTIKISNLDDDINEDAVIKVIEDVLGPSNIYWEITEVEIVPKNEE